MTTREQKILGIGSLSGDQGIEMHAIGPNRPGSETDGRLPIVRVRPETLSVGTEAANGFHQQPLIHTLHDLRLADVIQKDQPETAMQHFLVPLHQCPDPLRINPGKRFTRESRAPDQVPGAGKRLILRIEAHHVATASFPSPTTTSTSAAWTSCWPLSRLASANGESRAEPYKYYVAFPKTLCL